MKSSKTAFFLLFFQLPASFCAFTGPIGKGIPAVANNLGDANKTRQNLFCHRCVLTPDSFGPNMFFKQSSANEDWLWHLGSRNMFKSTDRVLRGGLLVTKGLYDSKQLETQMENKTYKLNEDSSNRFFYSLHRHLADYMNYSLEIKLFNRNRVLEKDNQLIDALQSKKIDVTVSPIVTLARKTDELFVEFLPAFQTVSYDVVLKQPRRIQSKVALALQLRPEVWLSIGALGVISAVTLYVIQKVFTRTHSLPHNEFSASECILMVISAFSQQGIPITPLNNSGRIACAFVLILGLMISTYYNAATVNALLTHAPKSIRTVEQIIASGHQLLFKDNPLLHDPKTRSMVITESIWNSLPSHHVVSDVNSGIVSVLEGNSLCGERNELYSGVHAIFNDLEKCDVSFVTTSIPLLARSYIQRYSPHREMMIRGSLRLKEHGLINRQYRHWFPPEPKCTTNPKWTFVDLTITAIAMAIIVFGLIASFVFFLFEIAFQALSKVFTKRKEHAQ